jgi:glycosyltransferase involved in cell wall biosynthesis
MAERLSRSFGSNSCEDRGLSSLVRPRRSSGAHQIAWQEQPRSALNIDSLATDRVWTINGRFLTQRTTGVQRYAREIVSALDALVSEGHPATKGLVLELLVPGDPPVPPLRTIKVRRTRQVLGHLWEQIVLPCRARGGILSLCNTSSLLKRKQIVCVHDLNFKTFPQSYSFAFRLFYRATIPRLLRSSSGITTVSAHSARALSRAGLAPLDRIRIAPNGHEHAKRWLSGRKASSSRAIDGSTVIVIGSPAAHKNVDLIIRLAPRLVSQGFRVAVVGALDRDVFRGHGTSRDIAWLGPVSDEELVLLYQRCLCLAFPSYAEGFGLPPLEAMTLGCPVVSSNAAGMPEVCGGAALYASPDDDDAWLHAFQALRDTPGLRQKLIETGYQRASCFSWRASAALYLDTMLQIDDAATGERT